MTEAALARIDWQAPWLAPWRVTGQRVAQAVAAGLALPDALNRQAPAAAVRFVPQDALPSGTAYEQYIFDTGRCPTRDGLHDFFNGLAWLNFPQTKRRLNHLQAAQIATQGIGATRGPVRDALTLFDENAALLQAPPELWQALLAQDWRRLFMDLRDLWAAARLVIFGHAALEKLVQPRKAITVHVYRHPHFAAANFRPESDSIAQLDAEVAHSLEPQALAAKPFTPLPVLGVPGWWPQNAGFSFYDDASVFRPRRTP
jgi:hypothetical protein